MTLQEINWAVQAAGTAVLVPAALALVWFAVDNLRAETAGHRHCLARIREKERKESGRKEGGG